jgi:hypothetical protein
MAGVREKKIELDLQEWLLFIAKLSRETAWTCRWEIEDWCFGRQH